MKKGLEELQQKIEDLRVKVYGGQHIERTEIELYNISQDVSKLQDLANGVIAKRSALPIQIVMCLADFDKGVEVFASYEQVKVVRELKDKFQTAIGNRFAKDDVSKWEATLTPLKKYWKFKRK